MNSIYMNPIVNDTDIYTLSIILLDNERSVTRLE